MKMLKNKYLMWFDKIYKPFVNKMPERKKEFLSESGIKIKELYTPLDLEKWDYTEKLGFPGAYPMTRGVYPSMYRGRIWTIRQYSGFGSAEDTNKRFKYLINVGQTGLSIAFDLPTQLGLDPDDELAWYEVGKVGVSMPSAVEMKILFDGISLDRVSTSMTINATAIEVLSMYIVVAESQGVNREMLSGTIQNDILKEYIARGNYIYPPEQSLRYATDAIIYCTKYMPRWNSISISGYHFEEAGATPIQEIAFTIANAIEYVNRVIESGMDVDKFAPRLSFFFAARTNLFEQIAKFRAARRIWAIIMKEKFNAKKTRSMMMRFHVQTAGVTLTAQQPEVNIVRTTIQALAAILGGAQSLHVNSYDEALCLPTEKAVKLSVRIQQVLAHESGVVDTIDPIGGSYYVEWLTEQIEEQVWKILDRIDELGGMVKAIEYGYPQSEISKSAYEYQKKIESGEIGIVGLNIYREPEEERMEILRVDPEVRKRVIDRLNRLKKLRDNSKVNSALNRVRRAAEKEDQIIFPYILDAIRAKATLGEISRELKDVWGVWKPPSTI